MALFVTYTKDYNLRKKMFLRFLKKNVIFSKYMHNLYSGCGNFNNLFNDDVLYPSVIDRSFNWARTKEGHEFWSIIGNRVRIKLQKYKI